MNALRLITASSAVLAASLLFACPAHAQDGGPVGNVTGGDVSGPGTDVGPAAQQQTDAKLAFAEAWNSAKAGGDPAAVVTAAKAFSDAVSLRPGELPDALRSASGVRAQVQKIAGPASTGVSAQAAATSNVLSWTVYAQEKNYWCGPATGRAILHESGYTTSAKTVFPSRKHISPGTLI